MWALNTVKIMKLKITFIDDAIETIDNVVFIDCLKNYFIVHFGDNDNIRYFCFNRDRIKSFCLSIEKFGL